MGVVLFSDVYFSETPFDFLVERALKVCHQQAIPCIDLRPTLVLYKGDRTVWASRLDPHPGPLLHRLVADQLMRAFGPVWLQRQKIMAAPVKLPAGASSGFLDSSAAPAKIETPISPGQVPDGSYPQDFW